MRAGRRGRRRAQQLEGHAVAKQVLDAAEQELAVQLDPHPRVAQIRVGGVHADVERVGVFGGVAERGEEATREMVATRARG